MEQVTRKPETPAPIFGLRYLEEESAEINGIAGCNTLNPNLVREEEPGTTYYTTACDYTDYD